MVAYRVAKCLDQLLHQVNEQAPHRSKASDGAIGDAAHQSRESDHNPWVGPIGGLWIVTARDFTHDPAGGFDAYEFAEILKARKDPRVKYVISNWRIWSLARDREGWRKYNGENGHTHHTHVSCTYSYPLFDSTKAWNLTAPGQPPGDTPPEDQMTPAQLQELKTYTDDRMQAYSLWLDMRSRRAELLVAQAKKDTAAVAVLEKEYQAAYASWKNVQ